MFSSRSQDGATFEKRLDSIPAILSADAGILESAPGRLRIVRHAVDDDPPGPQLGSHAAEVGVRGKERHLTFCIATICTVRIGLDEFSNGQAVRSFTGGDTKVFAHERVLGM